MAEQPKLTIKLKNQQPIELTDLTTSFSAIARQYSKFAVGFDDVSNRSEAKLFVRELRTGSIIADLVPYAQDIGAVAHAVAPYTEDAKKVLGFAKYLKTGMDALLERKKPPAELTTRDLRDFNQILEPIAKDPGAKFQFIATDGATQHIHINLDSSDTNTIQNQASKQIELMKEPEQKRFNNRLMYWHSATRGKPSKTSDKAIIETVSRKPMPVIITNPEIKEKMLAGRENPFLIGFLVDVELMIVRGEVRGYNILELHGALEDEASEDTEDNGQEA